MVAIVPTRGTWRQRVTLGRPPTLCKKCGIKLFTSFCLSQPNHLAYSSSLENVWLKPLFVWLNHRIKPGLVCKIFLTFTVWCHVTIATFWTVLSSIGMYSSVNKNIEKGGMIREGTSTLVRFLLLTGLLVETSTLWHTTIYLWGYILHCAYML